MQTSSIAIAFEKLKNTRDLGGMSGIDGRKIIPGKLIRSGHLEPASEGDIQTLGAMTDIIVDFRTDKECEEKPDPKIPGTEYIHLPAVRDVVAGMTREKKAGESVFRTLGNDPSGALKYMCSVYEDFVKDEGCLGCYRSFIDVLLRNPGKAVLWHCTAGKDRTGFAALLIQEILGVRREDIFEDYLRTGEYLRGDVDRLIAYFGGKQGGGKETEEALGYLFGTSELYLKAVYGKAEELYGSFSGFIEKGLKVTEEEAERLRDIYLD